MKRYAVSLALILLLVTGVTSFAQDIPVFCGDLSAADCTLLQESSAAMQALESTTFSLESSVLLRDLPDLPVDTLEFKLNGQGDFAADMTSFLGMMMDGEQAGMPTFFQAMADMLRGVNAEMKLSLALPADLSALLPETDLPEQIALDFRMTQGVAYINLAEIAALDPAAGLPDGWMGIDLAELYGEILPQQLASADMAGFDMTEMIQEFTNPEIASKFMVIERMDDTEIMGQTMAVFHTTLNYQNMLDIPAFRQMLESQISASAESDQEVEEALAMMDQIYKGLTFDITQAIGLDDQLVHRTKWTFDWDLSFVPDLEAGAAPRFTANMAVEATAFNAAFEVDVPEDATLLPLKAMLPDA